MYTIQQLRTPKIPGDIAAFDVVLTIAIAILYAMVRNISFMGSFAFFLAITVSAHHVLDIPTRLNAYLGINTHNAVDMKRVG
jgi:hypothetical protein